VLRQAAEHFVAAPAKREQLNAVQRHLLSRAGTWDGDISGEELLKMTRP
jgi:hypothetical protein